MNKLTYIYIILGLSLAIFSCTEDGMVAEAESSVVGQVTDTETDEPLAEVKITTSPVTKTVETDEDGFYRLDQLAVGSYTLRFELDGYTSKSANVLLTADEATVDADLAPDDRFNSQPTLPVLYAPTLGQTFSSIDSVLLTWSSMDANGDELSYDVRVYKDDLSYDEMILTGSTDTSVVFTELSYGSTYFWQVIAADEKNEPVYGEVWYFSVAPFPNLEYRYVAQVDDGSLQIFSTDISTTLQTSVGGVSKWRPRLDANRDKIAYISTDLGAHHLFMMNVDGSQVERVTNFPLAGIFAQELDYSWLSNDQGFVYPNFNTLYAIDRDGSGTISLYEGQSDRVVTRCEVSENDGKIAIVDTDLTGHDSYIKLLTADGEVLDTLYYRPFGRIGDLDFSASGDLLLFTVDVSNVQTITGRRLDERVAIYNMQTDTVSLISDLKEAGFNDSEARFSPNNGKVIFTSRSNTFMGEGTIMSMDLDGTTRSILIEDAFMPDWN